jgi:murein DD-endopeptidase MepM/ murein hydrolase activator NlpD
MIFRTLPEGKITGKFNDDYSQVSQAIYTAHEGIDIGVAVGTKIIINQYDLLCVYTRISNTGYGCFVILQDLADKRLFYLVAHLSQIFCSKGKIATGCIGLSGATGGNGNNMPAHLHVGTYLLESTELWNVNNTGLFNKNWYFQQQFAVNPENILEKWKGKLK